MAFADLAKTLKLPDGTSDRYRTMEALERMLDGRLYDDLPYSWETESANGKHVLLRQRRPSVDFSLAYEITQDTAAELFGDEQFPIVTAMRNGEQDDESTKKLAELVEALNLQDVLTQAYEEGVIGSVAVVVQITEDQRPYFDILPGKWCQPVYHELIPDKLIGLIVTYPINRKAALAIDPTLEQDDDAKAVEFFWYRYTIDDTSVTIYRPMPETKFAKLGEKDDRGEIIEFKALNENEHGFKGRVPVVFTKNLNAGPREIDGPCLWWPIRNFCVEIDYGLSEVARGLKFTADPMLFVRKGDLSSIDDTPAGYEPPAGGMATTLAGDGSMVKGATQTFVGGPGSDVKVLEISAEGIKEKREFAKDLREYALEVLGGMKARAEHLKGAASGVAIDKAHKPLRRLVRRQRRPYGRGLLLQLIDLVIYGLKKALFDPDELDVDVSSIVAEGVKRVLDWPNDEVLQGSELLAHATGMQLLAGGSVTDPKELISPEAVGKKLAADVGFHEPYDVIKGSLEQKPEPEPTAPPKPAIAKP